MVHFVNNSGCGLACLWKSIEVLQHWNIVSVTKFLLEQIALKKCEMKLNILHSHTFRIWIRNCILLKYTVQPNIKKWNMSYGWISLISIQVWISHCRWMLKRIFAKPHISLKRPLLINAFSSLAVLLQGRVCVMIANAGRLSMEA